MQRTSCEASSVDVSSCFRKEELAPRKEGTKTCPVTLRREHQQKRLHHQLKDPSDLPGLFSKTCSRSESGTCGRGRGGQALHGEGRLHHQLHVHGAQPAVGVCDQAAVRHQLVSVHEVPDVVDGRGTFQVAAGVVELDFEDQVLPAEENVLGLVDGRLLGDADGHGDLVWTEVREKVLNPLASVDETGPTVSLPVT